MNPTVIGVLYIISGSPEAPIVSTEKLPLAECRHQAKTFNQLRFTIRGREGFDQPMPPLARKPVALVVLDRLPLAICLP